MYNSIKDLGKNISLFALAGLTALAFSCENTDANKNNFGTQIEIDNVNTQIEIDNVSEYNSFTTNNKLRINPYDGKFSLERYAVVDLKLGDMDSDGDLDIVAGYSDGNIMVYLNNLVPNKK